MGHPWCKHEVDVEDEFVRQLNLSITGKNWIIYPREVTINDIDVPDLAIP